MFRFSSPVTLRLASGETLSLRHGSGVRLVVRTGVAHLTRQGDARDHFLAPGQAMDLHRSQRVVIEAAWADQPVLLGLDLLARTPLAALARWKQGRLARRRATAAMA